MSRVCKYALSAEIKAGAAVGAALCLLVFGSSRAHAQFVGDQTVTDPFGKTCKASELVGAFGESICPDSARSGQLGLPRLIISPYIPPIPYNPYGTYDPFTDLDQNGFPWAGGPLGPYLDPFGVTNPARQLGGPVQFSMYGSNSASGAYTGFDVSGTRNSGYGVTDSAGAIAPGSVAPGFHALDAGGGFNLTADGTRLLNNVNNQRLLFGLTGDYHFNSTDFGTSALTPGVAKAGSERSNIYTVAGSASYAINTFYVSGRATFDWSQLSITNNLNTPGAQGDTNGRGFTLNGTIGNWFPLFNTTGVNPAVVTKAPARPVSGYATFLDVSAHYGFVSQRDDAFTDNTGFAYGTEKLSYSDIGARARLIALVPNGGIFWMPFVGVTVDRQIGFSHTFDVPAQAATSADTLNFTQSNTFWGAEAGVDLLGIGSAKFGTKAFYQSSADTHTVGGSMFLKIPLWQPEPANTGIRVATGK